MYFSKDNVKKLKASYAEIDGKYQSLLTRFVIHSFSNEQAKEFALHGFTRRIMTLKRYIDNIYRICPPDIDHKLHQNELKDMTINLQAFVLNVYGSLDNLAWVWVREKTILNKKGNPMPNGQIGLSEKYKYVRESLPDNINDYLNTEKHKDWYSYIENFRHSLAHRIPLYVPPYASNEDEVKKEKEKELEVLQIDA